MESEENNGKLEPGWSDRVNDPEIAATIVKNRKAAFKWGIVTCIIALVAPTVVSKFAPDAIKPEPGLDRCGTPQSPPGSPPPGLSALRR